ncbi:hypothetical protein PUMCH_000072 [Australozyma saopauloensis]|uniref:Uncharacterized protein n=1 Tax=Australozyma saopauloensis TaxID=291208 RepID=A0AAX4H2X6_9ASCO|nr:hypothetical protein PUMCH_000072 [[Candida] saopauloensis]
MYDHDLQTLLDNIRLDESSVNPQLNETIARLLRNGLNYTQFESVIDQVLQPSLQEVQRKFILDNVLIPSNSYLLQDRLLLKIIACVGPSEVYYRNGVACKLRRIASQCQVDILRWLVHSIPYFGRLSFRLLRSCYPILFKLLTHEQSRPMITTLIIIGAVLLEVDTMISFREWHSGLIDDLLAKTPSDPSLHLLRWVMQKAAKPKHNDSNSSAATITKEDFEAGFIWRGNGSFEAVNATSSPLSQDIQAVYKRILALSDQLRLESYMRKRTKLSTDDPGGLLAKDSHLEKHIDNLCTGMTDNDFIFRLKSPEYHTNYIQLCLKLVYHGYQSEEAIKLLKILENLILQDVELDRLDSDIISRLAIFGIFHQESFALDLLSRLGKRPRLKGLALFNFQMSIIPHLPLDGASRLLASLIEDFSHSLSIQHFGHLVDSASSLICKLAYSLSRDENLTSNMVNYQAILDILHGIYGFTGMNWTNLDLRAKLVFTCLLRSLPLFHSKVDSSLNEALYMVPPGNLTYLILLASNPLLVSETLGYISYLKTIRFEDRSSSCKQLINAYVYDSVNFIWKELAFRQEPGSFNKGMFLHPVFIEKMGSLNFFGSSEFLLIKNLGGLSRNPAFAYLFAEAVWSLEDGQGDISMRHPGPLSEDSVLRLQRNADVLWINMSHSDIKTLVLHTLVEVGLEGLGQFLYSSVRSLKELKEEAFRSDSQ